MKSSRTYTMTARAKSAEDTRQRIIAALFDLGMTRMYPDISLDDVASEAGVSVQTILRHFKSRVGLVDATMEYAIHRVTDERATPVGDIDKAVKVIVDHYEQRGSTAMLMLAQEASDPQIGELTERGRRMHREWVVTTFSPFTGPADPLVDLLVVATDVYTWKLLRIDRGHSRNHAEKLIHHMVSTLIAANRNGDPL